MLSCDKNVYGLIQLWLYLSLNTKTFTSKQSGKSLVKELKNGTKEKLK